jgi:uncharacterized membrane protein YhiD involved in acid resistance
MNPHEIPTILASLVGAAALGAAISWSPKASEYEWLLMRACAFLAVSGALMMRIIDDEIARAFGLMGAASIVRYRYGLRGSQDATSLVLSLALGLACGQEMWILATASAGIILSLNIVFAVWSNNASGMRKVMEVEIRARAVDSNARALEMFAKEGLDARLTEVEAKKEKEKERAAGGPPPEPAATLYKFVYEVRYSEAQHIDVVTRLAGQDVGEIHVRERPADRS